MIKWKPHKVFKTFKVKKPFFDMGDKGPDFDYATFMKAARDYESDRKKIGIATVAFHEAMVRFNTACFENNYLLSLKDTDTPKLYEFSVVTSTEDGHYSEEIIEARSEQEAREIAESELEWPDTHVVRISAWIKL